MSGTCLGEIPQALQGFCMGTARIGDGFGIVILNGLSERDPCIAQLTPRLDRIEDRLGRPSTGAGGAHTLVPKKLS